MSAMTLAASTVNPMIQQQETPQLPVDSGEPPTELSFVFNVRRYIIQLSQKLAVMLSFGVVFPPLAVLALVSIVMQTYLMQSALQGLQADARAKKSKFIAGVIDNDSKCLKTLLRHCLAYCVPWTCPVLAIFVFDTIGASNHADEASAFTGAMIGLALLVYFIQWKFLSTGGSAE